MTMPLVLTSRCAHSSCCKLDILLSLCSPLRGPTVRDAQLEDLDCYTDRAMASEVFGADAPAAAINTQRDCQSHACGGIEPALDLIGI
jgi:hypothetical protein